VMTINTAKQALLSMYWNIMSQLILMNLFQCEYCIENVPPLPVFVPLSAKVFTTYCLAMYQNNKYLLYT